jgi:hypothetical protein
MILSCYVSINVNNYITTLSQYLITTVIENSYVVLREFKINRDDWDNLGIVHQEKVQKCWRMHLWNCEGIFDHRWGPNLRYDESHDLRIDKDHIWNRVETISQASWRP